MLKKQTDKMKIFNRITLAIFCLITITSYSQDLLAELEAETSNEPEKVMATFKGIKLINANTVETTKKKTLEFRITHRFGNVGEEGEHTLFGLDNASNIRFSFDYGVTDNLSIGIGRSKTNEHIDGILKFRFLHQTNKLPFSAAYFTNVALTPSSKQFNEFAHRLSYTHQLIVASKISSGISLEILPTLVHRNYVESEINPENNAYDENDLISIGFAARIKITKRTAFVADYFYTLSNYRTNNTALAFYNPFALGFEFETGGHVFHVNFTNSAGIIENDFIPYTNDTWENGQFKFGFNISRVFNI
ncbi:MAG: DUF5777 family beta-barrel protein [Vicingaceae bacterium]